MQKGTEDRREEVRGCDYGHQYWYGSDLVVIYRRARPVPLNPEVEAMTTGH